MTQNTVIHSMTSCPVINGDSR